jgi:putative acetyltransferase
MDFNKKRVIPMKQINMVIRNEIETDITQISDVTTSAFLNHPYSHNTEQFIVKALRTAGALTVSLVAELDGKVIGHIAFSPVTISDGSPDWYGLGPISVLPELQKQGIGKSLIYEGIRRLKERQAQGCLLVGDPNYYSRFGFTSPTDLIHEGVPQENFLALSFEGHMPKGTANFHQAFLATA